MQNNKVKITALAIMIFLFSHAGYSQNWTWLKRGPGVNNSGIKGVAVCTDRFQNHIMITGIDSGYTGYGAGPNSFYVAKYDNLGNQLWIRECKGTKFGHDIETDSEGNIYFLSEKFNFIDNQPVSISTPFCIVKLDPNGKFKWAGPVSAVIRGIIHELVGYKPMIEIDNQNNLYFAASINTRNFQILDSSYTYPSNSSGDVFVAKFDTLGKIKWSRRFLVGNGFTNRLGGVLDIDLNNNGRLAIAGFYEANIDINGQSLGGGTSGTSNPTGRASFLTVLDANTGNSFFAKKFSSNYTNNYLTGVILKDNGSVVSCAKIRGGFIIIASAIFLPGGTDMFFTSSTGTDDPNYKQMSGNINYHYLDFDNDNAGDIYASLHVAWQNNGNINDSFNVRIQRYDTAGNFKYQGSINTLNKFWYSYAHFKIRDSIVAVTGSVVPRFNEIRVGNNVISGGPDTIFAFIGVLGQKNNLVTGTVYKDVNRNGVHDPQEPGLPNQMVSGTLGPVMAFTLANGGYRLYVDSGNTLISPNNIPLYHTSTPPQRTINFNGYGLRADSFDFGIRPIPGINDLRINFSAMNTLRPGFPVSYYILYANVGTTTLSGTYSFKFTSDLTFLSSDSATSFLSSDSAAWSFSNLQPGQTRVNFARFQVKPSVPIGTNLNQTSYIYPVINDTTPSDNKYSVFYRVRGSFDPNDKVANPNDAINIDTAHAGKQFIDYTIRFQNTGTDTAFQVRITDVISNKLDLNSFELTGSTHPCQLIFKQPNTLEFYFPNIMLPDSNINEPKSHGLVKFRIKPKTSVILTDSVYNFADIYFDYNAAVRTNTVATGFRNTVITGINDPQLNTTDLKVFPNPATDFFAYRLEKSPREALAICIYDMAGRILFSTSARGNGNTLNGQFTIEALPAGIYFLEITGSKTKYLREFIVSKK